MQKSPILIDNAWEQRMFTTMQKKGAIDIKTPKTLFKIQIKSIFYENVLELISFSQDFGLLFLGFFFLRIYFLLDFISCDLIS